MPCTNCRGCVHTRKFGFEQPCIECSNYSKFEAPKEVSRDTNEKRSAQ